MVQGLLDEYRKTIRESDIGSALVFAAEKHLYALTQSTVRQCRTRPISLWSEWTIGWKAGWFGDYISYLSLIYDEDCRLLIDRKSNVKFSVVVPARNSASTLRYTINTILETKYDGSWELIVSDNSTRDNYEVKNLVESLQDNHIVYLKTPRDLSIPRSFEYAYLHARGEYVLGLGSDDGMFPWALEKLGQVVDLFPEEEVVGWFRGFYAWPGFNGGQQNQLTLPGLKNIDELCVSHLNGIELLKDIINDKSKLYLMPMLYINSCFKRCFLHTILEKTGSLWDGNCQDIYMGVMVTLIKDTFLYIRYPLTIAGMSSGSAGARSNSRSETEGDVKIDRRRDILDGNVGGYCSFPLERKLPNWGVDLCLFYKSLLRAAEIGVDGSQELLSDLDWKMIFEELVTYLDVRDVVYDRKIHELRYAAIQHGEKFAKWFDKVIYSGALKPRIVNEEEMERMHQSKMYKEDYTTENGGSLDALAYGVTNILEAVHLAVKFMTYPASRISLE